MISKICIMPRHIVSKILDDNLVLDPPWALISINRNYKNRLITESNEHVLKHCGCQYYLNCFFLDITKDEYENLLPKFPDHELLLFNKQIAQEIIDFTNKINSLNIPNLLIHCTAGISRSGAVGLWATRHINLNENDFLKTHHWIKPNYYVLDVLLETSGQKTDYEHFWDHLDINKGIL